MPSDNALVWASRPDTGRVVTFRAVRHSRYGEYGGLIQCLADILTVAGGAYVAHWLYVVVFGLFHSTRLDSILLGIGLGVLYALIAHARGLYRHVSTHPPMREFAGVAVAWTMVFALFLLFAFVMKAGPGFSRGSMIAMFLIGGAGLGVVRLVLVPYILRRGFHKTQNRPVVIVSWHGTRAGDALRQDLMRAGAAIRGMVEVGPSTQAPDDIVAVVQRAVDVARGTSSQAEIVLAVPPGGVDSLPNVLRALRVLPYPVLVMFSEPMRSLLDNRVDHLGSFAAIEAQRPPLSRTERFYKRTVDIVGASLMLALLAPIMVGAAIAVRLSSPGPVLFRQTRNGFGGQTFDIFKFRTMTVMENGDAFQQARAGDSRITAVGRVLRRSSIDELPQLLNVLRGEMSLVGPRPHAVAHNAQFSDQIPDYAFRHHVKPGMTGWAQVHGFRGETSTLEKMEARVEHDVWYVNNWSIGLDFLIALMTIFEVFRGRNAA